MKNAFLAASAVVALTLGGVAPGYAALSITLSEAGFSSTTFTESAATTAPFFNNELDISTTFGTFSVNLDSATGVNMAAQQVLLENSFKNVSTSSAGTLTITITETDLNLGTGAPTFVSSFSSNNSGPITTTAKTCIDPTNAGHCATTLGTASPGTGPAGSTSQAQASVDGLFSLSEIVTISTTGRAILSSDDNISVPEPSSLAILGAGLLSLGFAFRRRAR